MEGYCGWSLRFFIHNRARGQARDGATGGRPKGRDERDRASQIAWVFKNGERLRWWMCLSVFFLFFCSLRGSIAPALSPFGPTVGYSTSCPPRHAVLESKRQRGRALIIDIWLFGGAGTNLADGMGAPSPSLAPLKSKGSGINSWY